MQTEESQQWMLNFIIKPSLNGVLGFALFFGVLLLVKFLGVAFGSINKFYVDLMDIALSFLGFILLFLIRLLENIAGKEEQS